MKKTLFYIFATLLVLVWLMPFVITMFTSVKSMDELMMGRRWWEPPKELRFENCNCLAGRQYGQILYEYIYNYGAFRSWRAVSFQSGRICIGMVRFQTFQNYFDDFCGRHAYSVSDAVNTGISYVDLFRNLDSYIGVILFHIAFQLGFCTFFLRNFMKTIPAKYIRRCDD